MINLDLNQPILEEDEEDEVYLDPNEAFADQGEEAHGGHHINPGDEQVHGGGINNPGEHKNHPSVILYNVLLVHHH